MDPYYGPPAQKKADAGMGFDETREDAEYWKSQAQKYQREAIEAKTRLELHLQYLEALARE